MIECARDPEQPAPIRRGGVGVQGADDAFQPAFECRVRLGRLLELPVQMPAATRGHDPPGRKRKVGQFPEGARFAVREPLEIHIGPEAGRVRDAGLIAVRADSGTRAEIANVFLHEFTGGPIEGRGCVQREEILNGMDSGAERAEFKELIGRTGSKPRAEKIRGRRWENGLGCGRINFQRGGHRAAPCPSILATADASNSAMSSLREARPLTRRCSAMRRKPRQVFSGSGMETRNLCRGMVSPFLCERDTRTIGGTTDRRP